MITKIEFRSKAFALLATYTNVFDAELGEEKNNESYDFFVTSPRDFTCKLFIDSWIDSYIIEAVNSETSNGKFIDKVIYVYENDVHVFSGILKANEIKSDYEKNIITIKAYDYMILVSDYINNTKLDFTNPDATYELYTVDNPLRDLYILKSMLEYILQKAYYSFFGAYKSPVFDLTYALESVGTITKVFNQNNGYEYNNDKLFADTSNTNGEVVYVDFVGNPTQFYCYEKGFYYNTSTGLTSYVERYFRQDFEDQGGSNSDNKYGIMIIDFLGKVNLSYRVTEADWIPGGDLDPSTFKNALNSYINIPFGDLTYDIISDDVKGFTNPLGDIYSVYTNPSFTDEWTIYATVTTLLESVEFENKELNIKDLYQCVLYNHVIKINADKDTFLIKKRVYTANETTESISNDDVIKLETSNLRQQKIDFTFLSNITKQGTFEVLQNFINEYYYNTLFRLIRYTAKCEISTIYNNYSYIVLNGKITVDGTVYMVNSIEKVSENVYKLELYGYTSDNYLLLEDGYNILLEDNTYIELEG